ncbi:phosphotransferase [Dissulfurirhabdus thermomarina]|uniref:Phosphotransferase n=1 Tax=Dissulfurirhabdus thermomarina TaxID=1765737 RepID=A0A6N9TPA8_DISTH|nr:phosphotransferase [Dissulfurirhabdus thermomarina]NDY42999.1 phosphotransferase [Dissulfurirhabdus thermomarina]NMX23655.1 phosphotransferase [Dissulfurirhabdus thermomarina]
MTTPTASPAHDEPRRAPAPDGSDRRFARCDWHGRRAVVVDPAPGPAGRAEAESAFRIGRHLAARGVPVPEILAFDPATGRLVMEDLGDARLQDAALARLGAGDLDGLRALYRRALEVLAHQQVAGGRGFDPAWCHDTPAYDARLAREREAGYFLEAFVRGRCGLDPGPGLLAELDALAEGVRRHETTAYFLHRDFQSRNLMVQGDRLRVLDFQGGRLGPLAYDAAALLLDPYVEPPQDLWEPLLGDYLEALSALGVRVAEADFRREFARLALLRNLQVLGAFAFLSGVKGRPSFARHIPAALRRLIRLMEAYPPDPPCPALADLARRIMEREAAR